MRPTRPTRLLPLLALTAAVLLAHFALLQAAPSTISPQGQAPVRPFTTRAIETPLPAVDPVPTAQAPAAAIGAAPPRAKAATIAPRAPRPRDNPPVHPESIENVATAPVEHAQVAINSIATAALPAPSTAVPPDAAPASPPQTAPVQGPRAMAFSVHGPVRLRYDARGEARGLSYNAQAELLWRHDGTSYEARLDIGIPLIGSRSQTSAGRITAEGLAPTRFSDKARSELAAHFERAAGGAGGRVIFSANTPDAPLLPGAQDRLSVFLQLGAMLAGAPDRFPPGTAISLQIVGPRDADTWLFTVGDAEPLSLPLGELAAVKLTRNPRREFDSKVELWLAPAMGYVPVRIRLTQSNGDQLDQQLRSSESLEPPK